MKNRETRAPSDKMLGALRRKERAAMIAERMGCTIATAEEFETCFREVLYDNLLILRPVVLENVGSFHFKLSRCNVYQARDKEQKLRWGVRLRLSPALHRKIKENHYVQHVFE